MQKGYKNLKLFSIIITSLFLLITILLFLASSTVIQPKDIERQKQIETFIQVLDYIQTNYVDEDKIDSKKLVEGALKGMLESLDDPHSVFLTKSDMQDMEETTVGKFGGVGLYLLELKEGIEVARPIEGTPAFKAGINAGDIIIGADDVEITGLPIDEVINKLKGEPGTKVKITVLRGAAKKIDFTLVRELIEVPTVKKDMIPGDIGYLEINQFTPLTFPRVKEAIEFFKEKSYKSLIIDLRSNPGGLLSSVADIAGLFFNSGTLIVSTKSRIASENRELKAGKENMVSQDIPIVVLIDKYSASASEILTGVLKDYKRATVMGETSYGKGSVQQIWYIGDTGVKLTIAKYFTPSGISINKIGIKPDVEIKDEELTDIEKAALSKLYETDFIKKFVEENKKITEENLAKFLNKLKDQKIVLKERYVKRLINNEINRTNNQPPVYDLDYDTVLNNAVMFLLKGEINNGKGTK